MDKLNTRLHEAQLHEIEKHTENLHLRSEAVAQEIEKRRLDDPWGQTIAGIARKKT